METEKGDNWLIIVIDCELNSLEVILSNLWKIAKELDLNIPHFRFCARYDRTITFSFRCYLDNFDRNRVTSEITSKLDELKNQKNQLVYYFDGSRFEEHQKWISQGEQIQNWNEKRCVALHLLSNYVIYLIENNLFIEIGEMSREPSIHMLVNMMFLQETSRRYVNVLQQ